jgi:hypothetical protein
MQIYAEETRSREGDIKMDLKETASEVVNWIQIFQGKLNF